MANHYSDEKNAQILIALLKEHGIKKVVASPGTTNMSLIVGLQNDKYFQVYSSVDERSAAYMACGLAAESGEPVIISCTGATASRNYLSGLTEAYYRKLPILAITSSQAVSKVGHHVAQTIDRSSIQNDVANLSITLPIVKDADDFWDCELKVNKAILELKRRGGGPVHINLQTIYSKSFDVTELPAVKKIERFTFNDKDYPKLTGRVAVFIGSHKHFTTEEDRILDSFCEANNAVVLCDHTSSYKGKYKILSSLPGCQHAFDTSLAPDIVINIGEITGDYYNMAVKGKQIWRVSDDGELRDTYRKLKYVFEMPETTFFEYYTKGTQGSSTDYFKRCKEKVSELQSKIPDLPFSNIWLASRMAHRIPKDSTIHFAILNSLRSWNFFEMPNTIQSASNVGGFGIDGGLSSLIGASFANKQKLYFCVIGDLAFFYDMNVLGNRHVGNNIRILLVNNGKGVEFRNYKHHASGLGEEADQFVAAAGHFGNKSRKLVRHYAEDLGFEYLSAENKQELDTVADRFLWSSVTDKPILLEVFTDGDEEAEALKAMMNIETDAKEKAKEKAKEALKHLVGDNMKGIKKMFGK